jgi:hypothetical protein
MKNPFERIPTNKTKNVESAQSERLIRLEYLPDIVTSEVETLKGSINGRLSKEYGTREDIGDGITRYRVIAELRNDETEGLTSANGFTLLYATLTSRDRYFKIALTVDEKGGKVVDSKVTRLPPSWKDVFLQV